MTETIEDFIKRGGSIQNLKMNESGLDAILGLPKNQARKVYISCKRGANASRSERKDKKKLFNKENQEVNHAME